MDPQYLQAHLQYKNISTEINNIYLICLDRSKEKDCRNKVEVDLLNGKIKKIIKINGELNNMPAEIKRDTLGVGNPPPNIQKKRAPIRLY